MLSGPPTPVNRTTSNRVVREARRKQQTGQESGALVAGQFFVFNP